MLALYRSSFTRLRKPSQNLKRVQCARASSSKTVENLGDLLMNAAEGDLTSE
jgi:hypothetical protein